MTAIRILALNALIMVALTQWAPFEEPLENYQRLE